MVDKTEIVAYMVATAAKTLIRQHGWLMPMAFTYKKGDLIWSYPIDPTSPKLLWWKFWAKMAIKDSADLVVVVMESSAVQGKPGQTEAETLKGVPPSSHPEAFSCISVTGISDDKAADFALFVPFAREDNKYEFKTWEFIQGELGGDMVDTIRDGFKKLSAKLPKLH